MAVVVFSMDVVVVFRQGQNTIVHMMCAVVYV